MSIYRGRNRTEVFLASVLYDAIEDEDYSSVATLLTSKNADPNIVLPRRGISPFHLAVGIDSERFALKATTLIIQQRGDPNVRSDEGLTPVHIAAAWGRPEIVGLLLRCGGDPEITDNTYKNALRYSVDEGHEQVAAIIREFVGLQRASSLADFWRKIPCSLTLDKVVIRNAGLVGEYEMAKKANEEVAAEDLSKLPKTNSEEYVLNWCNSQILPEELHNAADESSYDVRASSSSFPSSNLSFPLSQKSIGKITDGHVNFGERHGIVGKDICYHRQSSRESGIATLAESSSDDRNFANNWGYVLLKTDSDASTDYASNLKTEENKDASSDYYTCTEASEDLNVLEQNIFEKSSSLSSGKSSSSLGNNLKLDESDVSCVNVLEIYRYADVEEGVVLYETRLLVPSAVGNQNESGEANATKSSKLSSLPKSFDYDTDSLRKELANLGYNPGPITNTTKRVYLRKLYHLKNHTETVPAVEVNLRKAYSNELEKTLREPNWTADLKVYSKLEAEITREFTNPDPSRRWREGVNKSSFTYLLLDPRITKNLPCRSDGLSENEVWKTFLSSIFYVGKGKRSRPYAHLYDAIACLNKGGCSANDGDKLKLILDVWRDDQGVICLHVFQNVIPVEAYTREAAMLSALKIENVTNLKSGDFYGVTATWTKHERNLLGVLLLHKAMKIFLIEGERQLSPRDID